MAGAHTVRTGGGVELHVREDGPPDAPVTVVLAHGWTLDTRSWGPVARALARSGRPPVRVVRYDHRGHGRSAPVASSGMTIDALADDLADLITAVAPTGPVVLAGHSMGGMTAMALAERHPALFAERVAGVALVSTAAGGLADKPLGLSVRTLGAVRRGEARLAASARFTGRQVLTRRPALLAPGVRALVLGRNADRGALRTTARCIADCRPATMVGFRPALDAHERDAALAAFAGIPTEVLVGTRDKLTPVRLSRRILESAGHARLTLYPGAGHMLPLERADGVAERLAELCAIAAAAAGDPAARDPAAGEAPVAHRAATVE
ncbi:MAG TPA: alpha/beta hydrolase [Pseudonocardia sp.]|jgi:pimeloyl-ACP methyl ester carboxylesterase